MVNNLELLFILVMLEVLSEMMEVFKKEFFEVLVFVNNVMKIILCDIDEKIGNVINCYLVEVFIFSNDVVKR